MIVTSGAPYGVLPPVDAAQLLETPLVFSLEEPTDDELLALRDLQDAWP